MELTKIDRTPKCASETKHITIKVNGKECFIWIWQSSLKYYIELSGWYTGRSNWSTSKNHSVKDILTEVSKIAMERTFNALERDNEL